MENGDVLLTYIWNKQERFETHQTNLVIGNNDNKIHRTTIEYMEDNNIVLLCLGETLRTRIAKLIVIRSIFISGSYSPEDALYSINIT